jgi:hypothetical protein
MPALFLGIFGKTEEMRLKRNQEITFSFTGVNVFLIRSSTNAIPSAA